MPTDKMIMEKRGPVGWMTFNNPAKFNAVSMEMWEAAVEILGKFEKDDDIRVVIVTGAGGKAFISGADISKFEDERSSQEAVDRYADAVGGAYNGLQNFPKPTIAMINGYCIGGGAGLAVCCDMRICSDTSRFAIPAAKLGLGYTYEHIKKLSNLVGPSFAKEIFFTARQFDAEEARTMGLVNRVMPAENLEAYVNDYAERIAANAPLTVGQVKLTVGEILKDPDERDLAACEAAVSECFDSEDYVEGRRAFMAKKTPQFKGR
ncbi:MAG: enoyl-CoA hydratase [Rhodospirillaceae bacterium]|jgi:enoyl-CoA hydratase|nr:enoyl-CoA hydratase [Rhodospirillaceae bacterium]MBT5811742.1 enoyl-CoA hydratase [Rhodospirillaceae bacterium]